MANTQINKLDLLNYHLISITKNVLMQNECRLSNESLIYLQKLIAQSVANTKFDIRIVRHQPRQVSPIGGRPKPKYTLYRSAELRIFQDSMLKLTYRILFVRQQNPGIVGVNEFESALKDLCPVWPFCR